MLTKSVEIDIVPVMKLSNRGEYALRALLVLGLHYGEKVVPKPTWPYWPPMETLLLKYPVYHGFTAVPSVSVLETAVGYIAESN